MRKRQGFTLVELLVAMALTIFIMLILTQAFVTSIDTFVGLKGIGDMQENLRAGANALRYDLSQAHLEGDRRMSDPNLNAAPIVPPTEGFLRVYQPTLQAVFGTTGSYIYVVEGTDLNPNGPSAARASNHVLHFASRLKGNQQQSFYSAYVNDLTNTFFTKKTMFNMDPAVNAALPGDATLTTYPAAGPGIFRNQWAEIAYWLVQIGTTEEPLNPLGAGTPIYGLYRAQFVLVTDSTALNLAYKGYIGAGNGIKGSFDGMACNASGKDLVFITPNDVANGTRIFDPTSPPTSVALLASTRVGWASSLVVPNVLSFQVQRIVSTSNLPLDGSYDSSAAPGLPPQIQGLYITLRVWDNKTRQSRQLSIMQDL
jgi:prepilin-type N-terminal cleavage/methylation domain-containing protein